MSKLEDLDPDVKWFVVETIDPADLAADLDRCEAALNKLFDSPQIYMKNVALKRCHSLLQYLRIANDIE